MTKITTKKELKNALIERQDKIIVSGELASSIVTAKKVTTMGAVSIAILGASFATIPLTGGLSIATVVPIATTVGLDTSVIIAIVVVGGIVIVLGIYKNYDVTVRAKDIKGNVIEIELRKK